MSVPRPGSLSLQMLDVTEHRADGDDVWPDELSSPPCLRVPWPIGCPLRYSLTWPESGRWAEPTPTVLDPSRLPFLHLIPGASSVTSSLWFLLMLSFHSWRRTPWGSWALVSMFFHVRSRQMDRWCLCCPLANVTWKARCALYLILLIL